MTTTSPGRAAEGPAKAGHYVRRVRVRRVRVRSVRLQADGGAHLQEHLNAARRVFSYIVAALLVCGVSVGAATPTLMQAVRNGDAAGARALLSGRVDVNATEADGTTPLHVAVLRNDSESVDVLLRAGADPKATTRYGVTPLYLACVNGNAGIVEKLMAAGADANTALPEGETALMTAA